MKIKDIHKTAGQQVQDWAVENQRLQGFEENLNETLTNAFIWANTKQCEMFWASVHNGRKEQELKERYPEILKPQTPKERAHSILKGLSEEVLEEIKKLIK